MADKTYKLNISKSDGSFSDSVQFTIPQREGTYKVEFELSNGNKVNAGNINVSPVEKTYKAEFQLSDGTTIDGGTFTTPVTASWHTVWEGTRRITPTRVTTSNNVTIEGYPFSHEITFSGVQPNIKTRISFIPQNEQTIVKEITNEATSIYNLSTSQINWTLYSYVDGENIKFPLSGFAQINGRVLIKEVQLIKVEQFY